MYDTLYSTTDEYEQLECLRKYGSQFIGNFDKPQPMAWKHAIDINPSNIKWIDLPTNEMQIYTVSKNGASINLIKHPCKEAQAIAIKKNTDYITLIDVLDHEVMEMYKLEILDSILNQLSKSSAYHGSHSPPSYGGDIPYNILAVITYVIHTNILWPEFIALYDIFVKSYNKKGI